MYRPAVGGLLDEARGDLALEDVEPVARDALVDLGVLDQQLGFPVGGRGRPRWTREAIVSELATWLLSGTAIDAQFMARNGPRGLVTAARRVFGRFDPLQAIHGRALQSVEFAARVLIEIAGAIASSTTW